MRPSFSWLNFSQYTPPHHPPSLDARDCGQYASRSKASSLNRILRKHRACSAVCPKPPILWTTAFLRVGLRLCIEIPSPIRRCLLESPPHWEAYPLRLWPALGWSRRLAFHFSALHEILACQSALTIFWPLGPLSLFAHPRRCKSRASLDLNIFETIVSWNSTPIHYSWVLLLLCSSVRRSFCRPLSTLQPSATPPVLFVYCSHTYIKSDSDTIQITHNCAILHFRWLRCCQIPLLSIASLRGTKANFLRSWC